jgi:hypothetical protein
MVELRNKYRFPLQVAALIAGIIAPLLGYIGLIDHLVGLPIVAAVMMLLATLLVVWVG